ncbi:Uncharacterised protein [uncultured archaeon]|nr:Uncharacterised protein [uncultured archaeon]
MLPLKAVVDISSSDLLNIDTTPVPLIPAPSAGYHINLLGGEFHYFYGDTPYSFTAGTNYPTVGFVGDSTGAIGLFGDNWNGLMGSAITVSRVSQLYIGGLAASFSLIDAAAVVLQSTAGGGGISAGNGTLRVTIYYTIEPSV